MRSFIFFCIISLSLNACSEDFFEQTVNVDSPPYEKKIAAHLLGNNNQTDLQIMLSRNYGTFETTGNENYYLQNATVEFFEEGKRIFSINSGTVGGPNDRHVLEYPISDPNFFKPGKTYELKISHPDYPSVTGKQVMPQPVQIDSVTSSFRRTGQFGDITIFANAYIKDNANEKNYYEIYAETINEQIIAIFDNMGNVIRYDTTIYQSPLYDEDSDDPNAVPTRNGGIAVSDDVFNGKNYKFVYKGNPSSFSSNMTSVRMKVWVRNITEEYYRYAFTSRRSEDAQDNPFAEPVRIFSNIQNGIGAFTLCHEQEFETK